MENSLENLKERLSKLKEKSRNIKKRMTSAIGASTEEKTDSSVNISSNSQEEELRLKISQHEQEKTFINSKMNNLLHEKGVLEERILELVKNNEQLYKKTNELEKNKRSLEIELNTLTETLRKFDQIAWNKYSVDLISQFIGESNRFFRNSQGMISEAINICTSSPEATESMKKKIALIADEIKKVLEVFSDAKLKYTFNNPNILTVNLKTLIEGTITKLSPKFQQRINVSKKYHDNECFIKADAEMLSEMLTEILLNSIEAIISKGTINIEVKNIGRKTVIEIDDSGEGIPPHLIEKVCCPFVTTKQNHTGLGLTRVYWLVQLHNGEIIIESQVNKGTKVRVIIPEEE